MTTPHTHADILRAIADGRTVQMDNINEDEQPKWQDCSHAKALAAIAAGVHGRDVRIKPDTVTLTMEIPAPMKEMPGERDVYWYLRCGEVCWDEWAHHATAQDRFACGIWPDEESARAAHVALVEAMAKIRGGV